MASNPHKKVLLRKDQIIGGVVKKQKLNHDPIMQDVEVLSGSWRRTEFQWGMATLSCLFYGHWRDLRWELKLSAEGAWKMRLFHWYVLNSSYSKNEFSKLCSSLDFLWWFRFLRSGAPPPELACYVKHSFTCGRPNKKSSEIWSLGWVDGI